MASLTIPNIFVAGTPALASEVNANFTAIVSWSSGLDQDNMTTFTGDLAFTIANGNAIVIQNNGNDESIKITQGALLGTGKASILITDNQTQVESGAAELKMVLAAGATIPAIHITHGVDTFKLTKDYLRLEAILKPPVKTTVQRNAIVSPEEGSVIYNSTTQQLNEKRSNTWVPVGCPVGSLLMYAGATAPEGWLLCIGSTVPNGSGTIQGITADFSYLYSVVGATLPDLRGRIPLGKDDMGGSSANRVTNAQADVLLGSEGSEVISLSSLPQHNHTSNATGIAGQYGIIRRSIAGETGTVSGVDSSGSGNEPDVTATVAALSINNTGSSSPHMPPYQTFNYIIKY